MKNKLFKTLTLTLAFCSVGANAQWFMTGSSIRDVNKDYRTQYDTDVFVEGKSSLLLESKRNSPTGFATVMQTLKLDKKYRGERVKLTASLKSENVKDWAGVWLRVDKLGSADAVKLGQNRKHTGKTVTTAFDNMKDRPLKGTLEWNKYSIVLDVDDRAESLSYGVLLTGAGKIWMDDVSIDVVDKSVPLTGMSN